jgi:hypothetical protein
MADTQPVRRSGRARTAVTSYADEQAQQDTMSAPPAKRRKAAAEASQLQEEDELMGDVTIKSEHTQFDEQKLPSKTAKRVKLEPNDDEYTDAAVAKTEDGDDFQPEPKPKKTRKKAAKKVKAIGKLDSEGVMRLDTTEPRPPGERKPPRVCVSTQPSHDLLARGNHHASTLSHQSRERMASLSILLRSWRRTSRTALSAKCPRSSAWLQVSRRFG